jgi:hypothetical protein
MARQRTCEASREMGSGWGFGRRGYCVGEGG